MFWNSLFSTNEPRNWNDKLENKILSKKQEELCFNRNLKWKGSNNYAFLSPLESVLKNLTIIDFNPACDISSLSKLSLERLVLEMGHKSTWPDSFPETLSSLGMSFARQAPPVIYLPNLIELKVWDRCDWVELPNFASQKLKSIDLDCGNLKHLFTSDLFSLKDLTLSGSRNLSLKGLSHVPELLELNLFEQKGAIDLLPISGLENLERLVVDGSNLSVPSLEPLLQCKKLKWLFLGNTKVDDGRVSILKKMPNLEEVAFNNKRSHDLTLEAFLSESGCKKIGIY